MVIGIDLGTTYSAVSYLNEDKEPQIIFNRDEETTTPSVVFVDGDDVIIGKNALKKALQWPEKICRCIKKFMGFREKFLEEKYSPEAISALILRRLIEDVIMRKDENIEGIVVTVPTSFEESKRMATKDAVIGALRGISERSEEMGSKIKTVRFIELIDEPIAAALYYSHKCKRKQGRILIYDLGGGTFDAALADVDGDTVSIIGKADEHAAGGTFFDDKIMEYVIQYMNENYRINLLQEKYRSQREAILMDVENYKKTLSKDGVEEVRIAVSCKHTTYDVVLIRDKFNELISPFISHTLDAIDDMLEREGYEAEEIDEVVLIGGSSKIPYVHTCLKEKFRKELCRDVDPEKAVTYGAAICADSLLNRNAYHTEEIKEQTEGQKETESKKVSLKLADTCTHSIGILRLNEYTLEKENDILIEENTPIVAEKEREYEAAYDDQTYVKIELTEAGEVIDEQYFKIPPIKKGTKVIVRIVVNFSHMIEVYIKIPSINFEKQYEIKSSQNLTEEEQKKLSGLVSSKKIH